VISVDRLRLMTCCFRHILLLPAFTAFATVLASATVSVERLPESGLQPQAIAIDGSTHLIYLTGDPKAADIVYRKRINQGDWSVPMRVNSQTGSAIAIGTIRGPQMAIGRSGRVHVVWNGSSIAEPKPTHGGSQMLYARLTDDGKFFSPQRNLMTATHELDGGGSVAADARGSVQVFWHASPAGVSGETNRAVYVATSGDDGLTFAAERVASPAGTGACGCCGLTAFANAGGDTFVLFRSARTLMQRDMTLLASIGGRIDFKEMLTDRWLVGACPMSSAGIAAVGDQVWAAWETDGRIQLARFANGAWTTKLPAVGSLQGAKHPRIAINTRGEALVVWTEGTGWQKDGSLAWQVFDEHGQPTSDQGRREGVPVWSYATAYSQPDGGFVILH
jgi:hypothetical protein